ncbi:MAG TPA: hypothetical protein VLM37_08550, partial [Fibrobacteraceae bacterium]|nr:hypothetical protein [Fibrobacteraceae bacterium]
DALTSIAAIAALLAGKLWNAIWLDPLVALLGAGLILRWGWRLLKESGALLVGFSDNGNDRNRLRCFLEKQGAEIEDLHIWPIDDRHQGALLCLKGIHPSASGTLRDSILQHFHFSHLTLEIIPSGVS